MTPRQSTSTPGTRQKSVLFCPECGHESDVDGDWTVREAADCRRYDCPSCGTTVTKRPRHSPRLAP